MYFREYVCRFSRKLHYFCILGVSHLKLRSHMHGAVAERRRADFDIPAPQLRVCSHIRGAGAGGSAISWGQWWFGARDFEAGAVNWVLDPFLAERFLLPLRLRSATAHVWMHVMICVEANFLPAPARVRPRMCERTLEGSIDNKLALVQLVTKTLPEAKLTNTPWCYNESLSHSELSMEQYSC